jgi:glutaredoxin 3
VYLRQQGIPFEERDINQDRAAREDFLRRGLTGVPSFLIGDQVVVGLNKAKIASLLDFQVLPCPNCRQSLRLPRGKGKLKITCPRCRHEMVRET